MWWNLQKSWKHKFSSITAQRTIVPYDVLFAFIFIFKPKGMAEETLERALTNIIIHVRLIAEYINIASGPNRIHSCPFNQIIKIVVIFGSLFIRPMIALFPFK